MDACDAYVLTVYPFGRNDEQPDDYELEVELVFVDSTAFEECRLKVNGCGIFRMPAKITDIVRTIMVL